MARILEQPGPGLWPDASLGFAGGMSTAASSCPHISRIQLPYLPIVEVTPDYSKLSIDLGFNWDEAFSQVECGEWYLVAFRSKHRADADHAFLTWLDERASSAASRHPGFMYYFIGAPMADGNCLSFCLWHSRQEAVAAATDPEHREAMVLGLPCFEHYRLERYEVRKTGRQITFQPLASADSAPHGNGSRRDVIPADPAVAIHAGCMHLPTSLGTP